MLDTPKIDEALLAQQREESWRVLVKRREAVSTVAYPFNPLDAVGWHGDMSVVRLNVRDIRPLMSHRYHLPPLAHPTFVGNRFVVCTFVPRPFETDPAALKVPFFHDNDDYDEVLFYHHGDFFSRDNIHPGMVIWHSCGFTHGPQPSRTGPWVQPPPPSPAISWGADHDQHLPDRAAQPRRGRAAPPRRDQAAWPVWRSVTQVTPKRSRTMP